MRSFDLDCTSRNAKQPKGIDVLCRLVLTLYYLRVDDMTRRLVRRQVACNAEPSWQRRQGKAGIHQLAGWRWKGRGMKCARAPSCGDQRNFANTGRTQIQRCVPHVSLRGDWSLVVRISDVTLQITKFINCSAYEKVKTCLRRRYFAKFRSHKKPPSCNSSEKCTCRLYLQCLPAIEYLQWVFLHTCRNGYRHI